MPALRRAPLLVAMIVTALLALTAGLAATTASAISFPLTGTLLVTSGDDSGGSPTGSYFVMRDPGGNPIINSSTGTTYTLLAAGTNGLRLFSYDDGPTPAFDASGNALADTIVQPTAFFGVLFSVATPSGNPVPRIVVHLGYPSSTVSVDLRAWTAYWNDQSFNQGALFDATSYNPISRRIVLDWSSGITSGPFAGFTGSWHIEGRITHLH